uniref:SUMO-interacting motif-containing protein 1 n=1 Tax=Gadus morhua TaxID=8049 RepID=A0A8C4ZC42_GADMO
MDFYIMSMVMDCMKCLGVMIRTLSADADAEADASHFMNKQCLDTPLLIDLSEPEWSPHWMGRFKQRPTGGEPPIPYPNPEVLGLENGHGCTRTDHASQTFLSNAIKVDPDPAAGHVVEMHPGALEEPTARWSQIKETPPSLTSPLPTQAEAAWGCPGGLVSETRESNTSDSKRWPYSQPSGANSPQVESTVLQYPESIASSESFQSIESQVNETCITARPARAQSAARVPFRVEPEESTRGSATSLCDGVPGGAVQSAHSTGWYLAQAETYSYCIDQDTVFSDDGPVMVNWHDGSDVEETYEEKSFGSGGQEDRGYVSPVRLQRLMGRPFLDQYIDEEEDGSLDAAKVLHSQSLGQVYSTMEESMPEATVQLLADLLQPGFYPPKDISAHLLRGLLLGARCPLNLRVQAFDLLMKTQRHHRTDRSTIPWDWELLITTLDNQEDPTKKHFCEVVRMLLEYVLRTMEDDFRAKLSSAALNESIARAFLSCTTQFTKVREVMGWLCAAIIKATAEGGGDERLRERDDHIRMVSAFQGMLRMALEVDCSPALSASRLSQELFHALLIVVPLRSHRKLLLDSLQSELLKCKLLQHLLEHSCSEKTALPMSLPLLLHFLKHSTLRQEPTDGAHRWPKWEELAEMLWMLLLSYNKVNKGDLRRPITETCEHAATTSPKDAVHRLAVCEAMESLLSRARADLGHDLPDHIEESLSYLQDQLLDVCQS